MFLIYFNQDIVCSGLRTLEEAFRYRQLSGDVVVDEDGKVVIDDLWLWDWERKDPQSYTARMIQWQKNHPSSTYLEHTLQVDPLV